MLQYGLKKGTHERRRMILLENNDIMVQER